MIRDHHIYAGADPHFYDRPDRAAQGRFAAADRPVPSGWRRVEQETWIHLTPTGARLPDQGWKIHVSATTEDAAEVIDLVSAYCVKHAVAHKFLAGPRIHLLNNSKYARRGSSGKLLALYPTGSGHLRRILDTLGPLLAGRRGPYILGDLRWHDGPLYLRYGGFAERWCTNEDGDRVLAIARPDGTLVPDRRDPFFRLPDWLTPPDCVAAQLRADEAASEGVHLPYRIERALHFSNGGGVYLARDEKTGRNVVLREARPLAGLDGAGVDAVSRLRQEAAALKALDGLDFVPRLLDRFTVWEHHYLAEEYIEGIDLRQFLAHENPMTRPDPSPERVARYTARVVDITDQLQRALDAIHQRGYVFGDLHLANVLLRPDGRVCLIDFEVAHRPGIDPPPAMGCPGFIAPHAVTGTDRDQYALDSMRLALFLPLTVLLDLDPGKVDEFSDAMAGLFPVPRGYTAQVRRGLRRPGPQRPSVAELFTGESTAALRTALGRSISACATPARADRLFPGDPSALHDGGYTLAHGAAGVLYALAVTGQPVDEEHTQWLCNTVRRTDIARPGLYDGLHGAALALHVLGRRSEAFDTLARAVDATGADLPPALHDGLAGVGSALLQLAELTGDGGLRDELHCVTELLTNRLQADATTRHATDAGPAAAGTPGGRAGLMHGSTGTAAFLLQLYESGRDPAHLDLAATALRADLAHCHTSEDGAVNLRDGARMLPYLAAGGSGIGLVLGHYLRHRHDEKFATALRGILLAARAQFVLCGGLFNGRAGLLAVLAAHSPQSDPAPARHQRLLAWHAVPGPDGPAFPGDQLYRLSTDLATGTAGVLLALHAASGAPLRLPGLPHLTRTGRSGPPAPSGPLGRGAAAGVARPPGPHASAGGPLPAPSPVH
ncbi:class III lanthionine synthetase LanKC [Streptomyces sp. RKAG293]|uniref:class III lanthionine synthetase LanKC n=1 Tax=Streptomyces sp. RKAG293 TaxID=2893403 RepID=UPI002033968F|nr:class III lanthionine synthetase LanKC [Streptomyces sp. RKAG293]MCM2424098.1 class III lanthionine synthetase LanKC [Streptomyces sp. RKAG293]